MDIHRDLTEAQQRALTAYKDFSKQPIPTDAKEFKAYHMACKAALAHLEALIKLAPAQEPAKQGQDIASLIAEARNDLSELEAEIAKT